MRNTFSSGFMSTYLLLILLFLSLSLSLSPLSSAGGCLVCEGREHGTFYRSSASMEGASELKVLTPNLRSLKIGGPKTWTAEIQHETPLRGLQNKYSEPKLHLRPLSLFGS